MTLSPLLRLLCATLLLLVAWLDSYHAQASPTPALVERNTGAPGPGEIILTRITRGQSKRGNAEESPQAQRRQSDSSHGKSIRLRPAAGGDEWAGQLTVGSQNFVIQIDPGSYFLVVDKGGYKPGPSAVDQHYQTTVGYYTGQPANASIYLDTVTLAGLTVEKTDVAAVPTGFDVSSPTENGIIGLGFPYSNDPKLAELAPPFLESAKNQGLLTGKGFTIDVLGTDKAVLKMNSVGEGKEGIFWVDAIDPGDDCDWRLRFSFERDIPGLASELDGSIDFGTTGIVAPTAEAQAFIEAYGLEAAEFTDEEKKELVLEGFDPIPVGDCDQDLGVTFGFAGQTIRLRQKDQWYRLKPPKGRYEGKCISNIAGFTELDGYWIIGQSFYQSAFVAHNYVDRKLGFAQKS